MNSGIKLGAIFPQTEIGIDPQDIREYTLAVERLDFDYILAFDHVLGADVSNRPSWVGPYTQQHSFHEPFVLFAYMAAITFRLPPNYIWGGFVIGLTIAAILLTTRFIFVSNRYKL